MANNSRWVLDNLREWLENGITSVSQLADSYSKNDKFEETKLEKQRLESKRDTLKMVLGKLDELEND